MKSSKLGEHEAEIEKLNSIFVVILRELKREFDEAVDKNPPVNAEMLHELFAQARKKKPKTIKNMSEITANAVQQATHLSDERMAAFKQLSERIMVECGRVGV